MTDNNRPNGTVEVEDSGPLKHSVNNFSELHDATGSASWELLTCPECYGKLATSWSQHHGFSWAIALYCDRCETPPWVICCECSSIRSRFVVSRQASCHSCDCHTSKRTSKGQKISKPGKSNMTERAPGGFDEPGVDERIESANVDFDSRD